MVAAVKDPALRAALDCAMDRPLSQPWWRRKLWQQLVLGLTALILLIVAGIYLLLPPGDGSAADASPVPTLPV